jgi:hypothetical protein
MAGRIDAQSRVDAKAEETKDINCTPHLFLEPSLPANLYGNPPPSLFYFTLIMGTGNAG